MEWLQRGMGTAGTSLAAFFTLFGEELILTGLVVFLYWVYDKEFGKYVGINLILGCVWNPMVKNIFTRRRPYFDNPEIKCLRAVEEKADIYDIAAQGYSFPSGHSTSAAASYISCARYEKKGWMRVAAAILCTLVAVSRVCLGVHYPTDVLFGLALGAVIVYVLPLLRAKLGNDTLFYLILVLSGLPGFFYCESSDFYTGYGMLCGMAFGLIFEERFVGFENTKKILPAVCRVALGLGIFLGLTNGLKLLFSPELLASDTLAAHLIRTMRYGIACFTVAGPYPLLFRYKPFK